MTVKEFNELVWNYGASGTKVLEGLTEKEKAAVVNTWTDVEFELNNDTEEDAKEWINQNKDFWNGSFKIF